jgi:nucleoside-diphosphate-sugar epimerase
MEKILVTGAGGYVGSALVAELISQNYEVVALDTYWYGESVFNNYQSNQNLKIVKGDIRNEKLLKEIIKDIYCVVHLACISNDPSFDLNPLLGKSINLDSFEPLVKICKNAKVSKFIYASSSSVYGVKDEMQVTEELPVDPLTDYSKYKAECELILDNYIDRDFSGLIYRPATVCGVSSRQRFDLSVNILTNHALNKNKITVFGGSQYRPNLHIKDMVTAYMVAIRANKELINGKKYNVGGENLSLSEISNVVSEVTGVTNIDYQHSNDLRSYRINSQKIENELNFTPVYSVRDAVSELRNAIISGDFCSPLTNPMYFNIARMKQLDLA